MVGVNDAPHSKKRSAQQVPSTQSAAYSTTGSSYSSASAARSSSGRAVLVLFGVGILRQLARLQRLPRRPLEVHRDEHVLIHYGHAELVAHLLGIGLKDGLGLDVRARAWLLTLGQQLLGREGFLYHYGVGAALNVAWS
jgi:hypothetical protein